MGQLRQNFVLQSEAENEIYAGSFWISVFVAGVISNGRPTQDSGYTDMKQHKAPGPGFTELQNRPLIRMVHGR